MGARFLPAAAKKGAISSLVSSAGSRPTEWLFLRRSVRAGRHAWMISIPKKVVSKSVRRSRIKRLVKEAVRALRLQPPPAEQWRFMVKSDPPKLIRMSDVVVVVGKLVESK